MDVWLNFKETIGLNVASLAPVVLYRVGTWGQKDHTLGYTGPCIVDDWLEVEGPFHDVWSPRAHKLLFGDLPLTEFKGARPPVRPPLKQEVVSTKTKPEPEKGIWTVQPEQPLVEADRLLANFLPRAFRRPVADEVRQQYVANVEARLKAGDCFETAMRWTFRAALCSPDFLYHVEPAGRLDDHALAARLSCFLWNSAPDKMLKCDHSTVEHMLKDPKSQRFIEDFLAQWLKLRAIAANDPDKKL